jgi:uncharacterized protein YkwD
MVRYRTFFVLFVIVLSLMYFFNQHTQGGTLPINLTELIPVRGETVKNISLEPYVNNVTQYSGQHLTLLGFIQKDVDYFLVDYENNKIKLISLRPPQMILFPNESRSEKVYGVRGILNKEGSTLLMEVRSIDEVREELPETPTVVTETPVLEERTDYFDLIKKKLTALKEESMLNKKETTVTQEYPDIGGIKLPAFCFADGTIDSEQCKCQKGYVRKWNSCVQVCKDGTVYGQCSDTQPYLCQEGELVEAAEKCGCPWRYESDGDVCVDFDRAVEKKILAYTNAERSAYGLNALQWDDRLSAIAREHSEDMVANDYFAHTNLRGEDPSDRASRNGYSITKPYGAGYRVGIAENIGMMPTGNVVGMGYVSNDPDSIARAQVSSWMGSPGHRANILDVSYSRLGVGVDYDGLYYIATQDFW